MPSSRIFFYRAFLAFTVGIFLSCAARISEAQPDRGGSAEPAVALTDEPGR